MQPDSTSDPESETPSRFHFYLGLVVMMSGYTGSLMILRFLLSP